MDSQVVSLSSIPEEIREVALTLSRRGFQALIVGGGVRDALLGRAVKDWDLCTSAKPDEVSASFAKVIPTGLKHGTVTVLTPSRQPVEVTTFRLEHGYTDSRHPDRVEFTDNLELDLARRDFTINAMAWDPGTQRLFDPFDGQKDLQQKIIRTVGEAIARFSEDGLRPVRAIRFAAQLGFTLAPGVREGIIATLPITQKVAIERLRDELVKMLASPKPSVALELLRETGLLDLLLPELLEGYGCEQNAFHAYDVYQHSLRACDELAGPTQLRLAALLHDVAKPRTKQFLKGANRFYGHDQLGAKMTEAIMTRLHFSNAERDYVVHLVDQHMFYYQPDWSDATVRRFIRRVGEENIEALITLRIADEKASGVNAPDYARIEALRGRITRLKEEKLALSVKDLALSGKDIMDNLALKPGPKVGEILHALLEQVIDDPTLNEKERLLSLARQHAEKVTEP